VYECVAYLAGVEVCTPTNTFIHMLIHNAHHPTHSYTTNTFIHMHTPTQNTPPNTFIHIHILGSSEISRRSNSSYVYDDVTDVYDDVTDVYDDVTYTYLAPAKSQGGQTPHAQSPS